MKIFGYEIEITISIRKNRNAEVDWIKREVEKYVAFNSYGTVKIQRIKALRQTHVSHYIVKHKLVEDKDVMYNDLERTTNPMVELKWAKEWIEKNYPTP